MHSFRTRRHHPLAAAGTAVEHIVLRHFGLQLHRDKIEASSPRATGRPGQPRSR